MESTNKLPDQNGEDQLKAEQRMLNWFALCDELMEGAPDGPTARELLEAARNRLERFSYQKTAYPNQLPATPE